MNFFEQQRTARKNTLYMVLMFVLAIALSVFLVNFAVWGVIKTLYPSWFSAFSVISSKLFWALNGLIFVCSCIMIGFHLYDLKDPLRVFLSYTHATLLPRDHDFYHQRLNNIVDEMSIAASMVRPKVFVIQNNWSINAFAVGHEINESAVFVTQGTLEYLSRDELQAVIAHEFSHILNGDMKSNMIMMAVIQGLEGVYHYAWNVFYRQDDNAPHGSSSFGNNFLLFSLAFAIMVAGSVGMFFSKIIKAGISRQREYLADASAVQFTRQTEGMKGVLKKIAFLDTEGVEKGFHMPALASHMMFSNLSFDHWLDTHPPILKRLQRLDPGFKSSWLTEYVKKQQHTTVRQAGYFSGQQEDEVKGLVQASATVPSASLSSAPVSSLPFPKAPEISSAEIMFALGQPSAQSIDIGHAVHAIIPQAFKVAVDSSSSVTILLASLLSEDHGRRKDQLSFLSSAGSNTLADAIFAHGQALKSLPSFARMGVVLMHVSSLSEISPEAMKQFVFLFTHLTSSKERMTDLEFAVFLTILSHIEDVNTVHKKKHGHWSIDDLKKEIQSLLWVLSRHNKDGRSFSYHLGWKAIEGRPHQSHPVNEPTWDELALALKKLNHLSLSNKSKLMEGMSAVIAYDGRWTGDEFALVRGVCFALHCPLPLTHVDI